MLWKIKSKFLLGDLSIRIIALILSGVFLFAAFGKSYNGFDFKKFLELAFNLENSMITFVYYSVIAVEYVAGFSILIFSDKKPVFLISAIIYLLFTMVIIWGLIFDIKDSCGCFGGLIVDSGISVKSLIRNLILTTLSVLVFWDFKKV